MSESPATPTSLLDVLSVLERNLPRAVAAASLGLEVRDALSTAPDLLSALLLSIERAERALFISRLSCVSKEAGACLRGDPILLANYASTPDLRMTLAKAEALAKIVPLLERSGVLATALKHPPARARLLLLASSDSLSGDPSFPLRKPAAAASLESQPGFAWLSLVEKLERAEASRLSTANLCTALGTAFRARVFPGQLSASQWVFAARLADDSLPPLSERRLRKVRARAIAEQLFVGDELQPWPE